MYECVSECVCVCVLSSVGYVRGVLFVVPLGGVVVWGCSLSVWKCACVCVLTEWLLRLVWWWTGGVCCAPLWSRIVLWCVGWLSGVIGWFVCCCCVCVVPLVGGCCITLYRVWLVVRVCCGWLVVCVFGWFVLVVVGYRRVRVCLWVCGCLLWLLLVCVC